MNLCILHLVSVPDVVSTYYTESVMRVGVLLICFLLPAFSIQGQELSDEHASDIYNLLGVEVTDINQDKTGFLWVGTVEGLYRYDGYNFKLYQPKEKVVGASIIQTIYIGSNDEMWIGTRGGLLKYNKNSDQFVLFRNDPEDSKSIGNNIINSIAEDRDHNLWIAFSKGGLDYFNRKENIFHHFRKADNVGLLSDDISDLHLDAKNNLWISTWNYGINKLNLNDSINKIPESVRFSSYTTPNAPNKEGVINFLYGDPRSKAFYAGTNENELFQYNPLLDKFISLHIPDSGICLYGMTPFGSHEAWVSTSKGIKLLNLKSGSIDSTPEAFRENAQAVKVTFIDSHNITWVGAKNGLIKYVEKKIKHYKVAETEKFDGRNNIMSLCKQGQYLWIGTYGGGLNLKDEKTGKVIRVNPENELLTYIWDIKLMANKFLLVGTNGGLVKLIVDEVSFRDHFMEENMPSSKFFTSLTKNKKGHTWIGTWRGGLFSSDEKTGQIKKFDKFSTENDFVQTLCLDRKNQLWIGTAHSGVIRLSNLDGVVESNVFSERSNSASQLSNDFVSAIYEDDKGLIWIGTEGGGINIFDPETEKITSILKGTYNLPSNMIKSIIEDANANIWVSFKNGISRYDPVNGFINYTAEDGVKFVDFNYKAAERSDSLLYFGNHMGYNSFYPSKQEFQEASPKVLITDFKINNKSLQPGVKDEYGHILNKPIYKVEDLTLSYEISSISFEFSSLDFTNPKREIYAYKLEGVSNDWIYTNAFNRNVTYSNLAPGNYVFKVKVIRNNTIGKEESTMSINIIPPFWQTTWFKIAFVLMFIGLIYFGHWIRLKSLRGQKLKFEKLADERIKVIEKKNIEIQEQTTKLHEADKSKLIFFTNISHEFRTPLMLITGPLTGLIEGKQLQSEKEKLTMIHRNAQRLLRLMDQIMDLSKIEAGSLTLTLEKGDLIKFCKDIASSFDYLATFKKIQYEFKSDVPEYQCSFDHDMIEKILYNLLSNAFKVTPQYGSISLQLELRSANTQADTKVRIEIFNTGIGIAKEELPNLFTRFYRTTSYSDGTGIGLSLTKSLVELQGGTIEVKSEEKVGTTFYVTIPIKSTPETESVGEHKKKGFKEAPPSYVQQEEDPEVSSHIKRSVDPNAKTILILDDDEDMRTFISQLLEPSYTVIRASNGEDAVKFAYQFQPDLIISDMIMPEMDGYQFMRAIKGDMNVSHIPIILLTARASIEARLQGLEEGADDYITKPFNEKILLARVKNLIEQRRMMKERFSTDLHLKPREMMITSLDEKFMQSLVDVVEANIAEPDFGSDLICRELGIGRSYLYSKVKALTDLSVNEFIKTQRLKRAAILLLDKKQNVNEVATNVGFTDRSHFSKSFTKHFGIAPAQYQKQNIKSSPSV